MLFANAELRRSKARFGMLTVGTGLLVFVLLFQQALLTSLLDGIAGAVGHQSAPVLVLAREAQRSVAGSFVPPDQFEAVAGSPGVADASELGVTGLSIRHPNSEERHAAAVLGYQPNRPGTPTRLRAGRLPEKANETVASAEDAAGRYKVGDTILIDPGEVELTVVGLTEESRLNVSPTLWTPWETYEELVRGVYPETPLVMASAVAIEPSPGVSTEALIQDLNAALPDLEAVTREEAVTDAPGRDAVRYGFLLVMGLGYIVVAIVIGFFFLTLTLQKEPSITLVRAMGAKGGYVVSGLVRQLLVVILGGLTIGSLLLVGAESAVEATIPITVDPMVIVQTAIPVMVVGLLGIVSPVRRVLRTDPQAAISRPSMGGT